MTKTKLTALAVAATTLVAAPLAAQELPTVEDLDGNGTFSMEELSVAYPELTEELYAQIDADGEVGQSELEAAVGAGLLTAG